MKRFFLTLAMAILVAGFCGCDDETNATTGGSTTQYASLNGNWTGTMQATQFMGQPAASSDIVPIALNITETSASTEGGNITISVVFQANGLPGIFSGSWNDETDKIMFSAIADYTYIFTGMVNGPVNNMSGTWTVSSPGGMSGTWQARR